MKNEICVAPDGLGVPDENGEMVAPEIGDEIEATITGKVSGMKDGKAYIEVMTVNGNPVMKEKEESDEEEGVMSDDEAEKEVQKLSETY